MLSNLPKISIITINYNNVRGLNETLKSITEQTYENIEYIVVDGASTDGSDMLIDKFINKISSSIIEPDAGIYNAMNKGVKVATGDYLLFINSGDRLMNDCVIENAVDFGLNEDLIYGDLLFFDKEKEWAWHLPDTLTFEHFYKDTIPHPSTFIKKQLFEKIGHYDEELKIVSDWKFFTLATAKFNCTYRHIPMIVTAYSFDGLSSKPENLELINSERSKVLGKEFSLFIKDYETLKSLGTGSKHDKYFTKIKRFFKNLLKMKNLLK